MALRKRPQDVPVITVARLSRRAGARACAGTGAAVAPLMGRPRAGMPGTQSPSGGAAQGIPALCPAAGVGAALLLPPHKGTAGWMSLMESGESSPVAPRTPLGRLFAHLSPSIHPSHFPWRTWDTPGGQVWDPALPKLGGIS